MTDQRELTRNKKTKRKWEAGLTDKVKEQESRLVSVCVCRRNTHIHTAVISQRIMLTVRSAGQHWDAVKAHHTESDTSPGERAVRNSVRQRAQQERALDAAQREDGDSDGGWEAAGGGSTVRALLSPFTAPVHHIDLQRAHRLPVSCASSL